MVRICAHFGRYVSAKTSVCAISIFSNIGGKAKTFPFWIELAKSLDRNRNDFSVSEQAMAVDSEAGPSSTSPSPVSVDTLIEKCLIAAAPQWNAEDTKEKSLYDSQKEDTCATAGQQCRAQ